MDFSLIGSHHDRGDAYERRRTLEKKFEAEHEEDCQQQEA
jgi:hypothetical protein